VRGVRERRHYERERVVALCEDKGSNHLGDTHQVLNPSGVFCQVQKVFGPTVTTSFTGKRPSATHHIHVRWSFSISLQRNFLENATHGFPSICKEISHLPLQIKHR